MRRTKLFFGPKGRTFISTWKTDNLSTGSSTSTQVRLPLTNIGTYNMTVDWGDGNSDIITVWNQAQATHTYSVAGTYQIKIKGICRGFRFNNTLDRLKLLSIQKWGCLEILDGGGHFFGCTNLTLNTVEDIPDLTLTTSLQASFLGCTALTAINKSNEWDMTTIINISQMFQDAVNFNSNVSNWNVSNVTTFASAFINTKFNQNVGGWNVSKGTTFSNMFQGCTTFNNGGVDSIKNWVFRPLGGVNIASLFRSTIFNHPLDTWDVSKVVNLQQTFMLNTAFNQDLSSWNTSNVTNLAETFNGATSYTNLGVSLNTWNVSNVTTMTGTFRSCAYNSPLNLWNTGNVTNMSSMFFENRVFNQNINSWNVTKVTTFSFMFAANSGTMAFNQPLNSWVLNTTTSVSLANMFEFSTSFNQNINNWNTSKVTTMARTFRSANSFNQPLNLWDLSSCTTINNMFWQNPTFNQDLSAWNTTTVTNMSGVFLQADNFDNAGVSLNTWNVSNVTTMASLFSVCKYNLPLNLWNTGNVTNISACFKNNLLFNQNLGSWNVSKVTTFAEMFNGALSFNNGGSSDINNWVLNSVSNFSLNSIFTSSPFNQPVNNWNTTKCTDFNRVFYAGSAFNQPLNNWDTSNATTIAAMFYLNTAFTYDISDFNISNVTVSPGVEFMIGKSPANYSDTNYDLILNKWTNLRLNPSLTIGFGTIKRTAASTEARALLTRTNSTKAITNAVNNGSGLIRISATAHGLSTGNKCFISGVLGTTEANGPWIVTVVDANTIDLQGSTFTNAYTSAGTLRTGYGWVISDGGI